MLYFYSLNQGQRSDGSQFRSSITTDAPIEKTKSVSIGSQSASAGTDRRSVKYGVFNPKDENNNVYSFDNPWWDTFIEDFDIDMENPIKTGDKSKDSWFNTYQGNFALLSEDLELTKDNIVNSNGETVSNVYYIKTM